MNILIVSVAPWCPSGYGTQTKHLSTRLRDDGHTVTILSIYGLECGAIVWEGIPVYSHAKDTHCNDVIHGYVELLQPDIVISLMDVWELKNYDSSFRWIPWVPVDHEPLPPMVADRLNPAWKILAMSHFGEKQLADAGFSSVYMPLGIAPEFTYNPIEGRQWRARFGINPDKFVVGTVGMNMYWPPRKGFDRLLEAFSVFYKHHPDAILFLHTSPHAVAVPTFDLYRVADAVGLPREAMMFSEFFYQALGYSEAQMAAMYNGFDCFVLATQGEGFGIPIVEAQACGVVPIVTDCTTIPELTAEGLSERVPWSDKYLSLGYSYQFEISIPHLVDSLEAVYLQLKSEGPLPASDGGFTYHHSLQMWASNFDWDRVYKTYWKPFLTDIQKELNPVVVSV